VDDTAAEDGPQKGLGGPPTGIGSFYAKFAVLLLNTTILGLVFLFLIEVFVDWRVGDQPLAVYSRRFDLDSYSLTDRQTAIAVGREFDRMGEAESYEFHPWAVSMERRFDGRFLTVEEHFDHNRRGTKPPAPADSGKKEFIIWLFGGSTMFGWGLPDDQTIASHVQDRLQRHLPQFRVKAVNHGHSYWFSSQEIALYVALLRTEPRPDVAMFLDGINDCYRVSEGDEATAFWANAYAGWELLRKKFHDPDGNWFEFGADFPLVRLLRYLQMTSGPVNLFASVPSRYKRRPDDPVSRTLQIYRTNRDIAEAVSRRLGIDVHFFWQPTQWYMPDGVVNDEAPPSLPGVYDALVSEASAGSLKNFHTLHDALWNVDKAYVDRFHYSDKGSQILARKMVERVSPVP
jgi:hypothetical protein